MVIRSTAPLRISFAGGGTDIHEYFSEYGGAVINSTIDWYAHCHLTPVEGPLRVVSLDYGTDEKIKHFSYDGKNDLLKATINKLSKEKQSGGAEFLIHTDAPPGSGLGSSSAVVVSLIGVINAWTGRIMDPYEMAENAYDIERKELGIKGGFQDQFSSTFGGFNFIEFPRDGKVIVNPLRISRDSIKELECHLLLCYTGKTRLSGGIIERQVGDLAEGKNIDTLREQKILATDMKNALVKGGFDEFGDLLHIAWESKKHMVSGISNPEIDKLYEKARSCGAIGGKILGAGGGGYMLLYCDFRKRHEVDRAMREMGAEAKSFSFTKEGLTVWRSKNEH
jgi:D-glycero-alpha-D-manno-heptose-7-phosphate kinase